MHHLAVRKANLELPSNLGSGSSVSHLCDRIGCIKLEHLEISSQHQENLTRQRCQGLTLVIADVLGAPQILTINPCVHGIRLGGVKGTCRKLRLVTLDGPAVIQLCEQVSLLLESLTPVASIRV